jgi:ribosomal RNA-processing protein 8
MSKEFRYYQQEADIAIYNELLINDKCIVKMFCGTGKSLLMRRCKIIENKKLIVYVFPSLSLIDQFYKDYLYDYLSENILKISSENEATTNPNVIKAFLSKNTQKIICITYQSFNTLLDNIGETKINVCIFDEAHHAVGETYQILIFQNTICEKQIFFTATPKNANGIVMYDKENLDAGMCGKLVYDYSYLRGMNEDYLNPFDIRIELYTENTNQSFYESIARAILSSGNNRVLTFHADVNTDRDTSVNNFVNNNEFKRIFKNIQTEEFPKNKMIYKKVKMSSLSSCISGKERENILNNFDATKDNEVMVISSCETIGEGIDTKNANMCVFVDPKSSFVKIIQNIGRIVRKKFGVDKPKSTILIPCWVDKNKYLECEGDREKCDEVIRQEMNKGGNFNGILNVLSALKQEDEDLYDICIHYPHSYSPQEIKSNLERQGYVIDEPVGDGGLIESLEHLLDNDIDYEEYEECENDEETIMQIAKDNDICIEVHTNSLENPVEKYNSECESSHVIRLYKSIDDESEEEFYLPIIKKNGMKRNRDSISGLKRENRFNIDVHTNEDVKILWNITSDFDITKDICSCVIDCEIIKYDPMLQAVEIVERAKKRVEKGLNLLPRRINSKENRTTTELQQQHKDMRRLDCWRTALKGKGFWVCPDKIRDYLDKNLPGWNEELDEKSFKEAVSIVERAKERVSQGLSLLPKRCCRNSVKLQNNEYSKSELQEKKDAIKLKDWKNAINGKNSKGNRKCYDKVRDYLDNNLPGWSEDLDEKVLKEFISIVERAKERIKKGLHLLPKSFHIKNITTPQLKQEKKDNTKLQDLKRVLHGKSKIKSKINDKIRDYLDKNLPGWSEDLYEKAFKEAVSIVERAKERVSQGLCLLPKRCCRNSVKLKNNEYSKSELQEQKDAIKLLNWKNSLKGDHGRCDNDVCNYLDKQLPGWRPIDNNSDTKSIILCCETSSIIADEKEEENIVITPKKKSMKLKTPTSKKKETPQQKRERVQSEISQLHKKYKTMKSENLSKEFNENPELWHTYHEIAEENEKSFPDHEIPRNRIIQELNKIKTKRSKKIVDMGCGKAQISQYFQTDTRFQFINYDHISSHDTIISCDISNTPLEEDSVEICILSLAMWGSNCREYIQEANRILESNGKLYIIEPTKRWSEQDENGNIIPEKEAYKMKLLLEENGFQIVEKNIEKFCLFICIKV